MLKKGEAKMIHTMLKEGGVSKSAIARKIEIYVTADLQVVRSMSVVTQKFI